MFVYLIPAVFFFGIGVVPGVVATTVFAPAVRITELGIRQVDPEMVEAAEAFGSPPAQVLREDQLPLALPYIMAGINQVIMLALSMVVVAGLVGAAGLGSVVVRAVTQLDVATGFEGGIAVVILAIYLDLPRPPHRRPDRPATPHSHPQGQSRPSGRRTSARGGRPRVPDRRGLRSAGRPQSGRSRMAHGCGAQRQIGRRLVRRGARGVRGRRAGAYHRPRCCASSLAAAVADD